MPNVLEGRALSNDQRWKYARVSVIRHTSSDFAGPISTGDFFCDFILLIYAKE